MANIPYSHSTGVHDCTSVYVTPSMMLDKSLNKIKNIVTSGLSAAPIIGRGVVVWGSKLMVRDLTVLPVFQALSGKMSVLLDSPGGEFAGIQGVCLDEVTAAGTAASPTGALVLAPKLVALAAEDTPVSVQLVAPLQQPAQFDLSTTNSKQIEIETVAVNITSILKNEEPLL